MKFKTYSLTVVMIQCSFDAVLAKPWWAFNAHLQATEKIRRRLTICGSFKKQITNLSANYWMKWYSFMNLVRKVVKINPIVIFLDSHIKALIMVSISEA